MKNQTTVNVINNQINIPLELFRAMGDPKIIRVIPVESPGVAELEKYQPSFLSHNLLRIKRLAYLPLKKRLERLPILIKLQTVNEQSAVYCNTPKIDFEFHNFNIINYHPCYYLMPSSREKEAQSREQSWEEIADYHEHLEASLQDKTANKVSDWLASKIFTELKAKSFLELGCGAGRNLIFIHNYIKDARTYGVDINKTAIKVAQKQLSKNKSQLAVQSVYDLSCFKDNSIDVVFTCGVLMHIPHENVEEIVKQMNRIAKIAVVHFELDGPSHRFDFHRYPRDYKKLYGRIKADKNITYTKYPATDYRSNMALPFSHALLISK